MISIGALAVMAGAAHAKPSTSIIDDHFIGELRSYLEQDIVLLSVRNQNKKYQKLTSDDIIALDKQWRGERKEDKKPLISATLSNPLSSYLTRLQAHALGLYSEIFIMDDKGLNVGQSNISSDFWQGDEAKWQKTFKVGQDAIFIDDPEWNSDTKTWRAQVNMSISDPKTEQVIGAATFEVNLTELERRKGMRRGAGNE